MKRLTIILSLMFLVYVTSYVLLRREYMKYMEVDGCPPPNGCESITFPPNKLFLLFSPLIIVDRFINHTEIYIENW